MSIFNNKKKSARQLKREQGKAQQKNAVNFRITTDEKKRLQKLDVELENIASTIGRVVMETDGMIARVKNTGRAKARQILEYEAELRKKYQIDNITPIKR